ncbi:MAG TPA: hypothetical protein VL426_07270 [Candidatus Binatia bacterium]|jgi:hypothetical protein|nr:hypothetical protein [Candidatus Binatia bacterium]
MKPFVMRDVPRDVHALFKKIRRTVRRMPTVDLGKDDGGRRVPVSCHMVCRALAADPAFKGRLLLRDGYFGEGAATHSWLLTEAGLLIDPYPWAMVGGPVMVSLEGVSPWRSLYREADLSGHFRRLRPAFDRHVAAVTTAVRETLRRDEPRYDF